MRIRILLVLSILMTGASWPSAHASHVAPAIELYGTFHAMGVVVTVAAGDDPDGDAAASLMYRISGSGSFHRGLPLSRTTNTRFVGSLFWLQPGTSYDVRVAFSDPDGDPLNGATVEATALTRVEVTIPASSHTYYVSPTGSGTICSVVAPCPLVEGLGQAQPGEEIVLRGGVYYEGEISLPRSGVAGAPITIRGYPGETPILDGADPATFTWTYQGGGVWTTTVNVAGTHLIVADGNRLYPYQNLADLQTLKWGIPGFHANGTTVSVHLAGDANPNHAAMAVSRQNYAFWVQQSFIYMLNLTFRHYGQGDTPKAIYLRSGSDNLLQGCTFAVNDIGIALKGDAHRNVIQGNEFYDTISHWPWDSFYAGSGLADKGGIRFRGSDIGSGSIPRGTVIRRNTFHDVFDGFGACPYRDLMAGVTNETDVYENLVFNAGDDGMETDGDCSNVRIWKNTFHDVLVGMSLSAVRIGPTYALRNLVYSIGRATGCPFGSASNCGGTAFKFQHDSPGSGPVYLFHNTADAANDFSSAVNILESCAWQVLVARNNAWISRTNTPFIYNVDDPADFDYNEYFRREGWSFISWRGVKYWSMPEFTAATGQERHGLSVPPDFADVASGNYRLSATSQLVDAGVHIPGVNDDFTGNAPDIGAFERWATGSVQVYLPAVLRTASH